MDRQALENSDAAERDPHTEEVELLLRKGRQHEAAVLRAFEEEGRDIVTIERGPQAAARTREAIVAGREVVCQAALSAGPFAGFADFLLRADPAERAAGPGYLPLEAKLTRTPRPGDIVQLCCYADLLAHSIDPLVPSSRRPAGDGAIAEAVPVIALALGSGETVQLRTAEFIYYYAELKRAFLEFMDRWDPRAPPIPEASGRHRPWERHAAAVLLQSDHPSRVAGITAAQTRKLIDAGLPTLRELAQATEHRVPGMNEATFRRLCAQARLQAAARDDAPPPFEVIPPLASEPRRGLALLPPASPLDVYFDMEGFPLARQSLEYLFGATYVEEDRLRFRDWWAHDGVAEQRAFEGFIDWVYERFRREPAMHVYHYAQYETAALKRLMGRFGTREDEMDVLMSAEVFVDLFQVVRSGLVVGTEGYSIKHIERLYRPAREGGVGTAVDSMVFYQRFLDSGEPGDWEASPILRQIRDYNRDDCDSTLLLLRWLRQRAEEHGIGWVGRARESKVRHPDEPLPSPEQERRDLIRRLSSAGSSACALFGHLLEFHRREDRPMWWAMFDRHEMTDDDLIQDVNCLGGLRRGGPDPAPAGNLRRFRYTVDAEQDTKLRAGDRCFFAHDLNVTLRVAELDLERGVVTIELNARMLERIGAPPERLALIPSEYVPTDPLQKSIEQAARRYLDGGPVHPALDDFLERRPPRFVDHAGAPDAEGGPLVREDEEPADAVVRQAPFMAGTTLFIQGPPGSGKTTTAARTIVDLIARGRTVGITSNSHSAIVNLMRRCAALRGGRLPCVKVGGSRDGELFDACEGAEHCPSSSGAAALLRRLPLMGGTAWLFSRPEMAGKLDYLFVDEAGQVSVANLVGMAQSAANIVLVGDQMQLPQPIQGAHPGDSGASTLDYFLSSGVPGESMATIPPDRGVFLGTTYRLHPELCALISSVFYEGRLRAAPATANRVVRVPPEPGLVGRESGVVFVPVAHEGNTQASPEEVAVICGVVRSLIGRERTGLDGRVEGLVGPRDILVVAPYNLQVRKLQQALPADVRAGTVDKFQGQEAPVVIVSLCASEGHGSPRGLEFLLNPNRLNVALSRAQSLAVVVGHPGLLRTACTTLEQLKRVNLLCRISAAGGC